MLVVVGVTNFKDAHVHVRIFQENILYRLLALLDR